MTRRHTKQPCWEWVCDECGRVYPEVARSSSGRGGLPSPAAMRRAGWYIAEVWGDLCPGCAAKLRP